MTTAVGSNSATITGPEGDTRSFANAVGSTVWSANNSADTLLRLASGSWVHKRAEDDVVFNFSPDGKLQSRGERNGWLTAYAYTALGQLATVTNPFGRRMSLSYDAIGQLVGILTPDGRLASYSYADASRLSQVTYPDGRTRAFLYEKASFPYALTGLIDENGARFATFAYDYQGRAVSTELAGGVGRYQVSYPGVGAAAVFDPLRTSRSYSYGFAQGKLAVISGSLPSGEGESDARSRVQDASGLITSETDFVGVRTDTAWDSARRLPLSQTEAAGAPEARTTNTQWHPVWALPVLVSEAGRTMAYGYDAQGNKISLAVTDSVANQVRLSQWTYNAQGLLASETAPNGAVARYFYDSLGNLIRSINALGHVSQYGYDSANRLAIYIAPNGLVSTYTWDARDRLVSQTVNAVQTTLFTYTASGQLASVRLPAGLAISYGYDAAHRLTGWTNNRGETGNFTLDAMGNRVAEQIKNAAGAVAWQAVGSVNNINRLSARTEGLNQTNTFSYDANGELAREANGLNQGTSYGRDGLRRVWTIINSANATASLAYNALDAVTQAQDFKGVATGYTRDAWGNAIAESSTDAGPRNNQYDSLGLPSQIVDALGQATLITRDALGRPTSLTFADGKVTTLRYDLSASALGYLSEIVDRSGTTSYTRDAYGRVTLKRQTLSNASVQTVAYSYAPSGLPDSIRYFNGDMLGLVYDATGRLTQLTLNALPLVSNIAWNPLGQPTGWRWAFVSPSLPASRNYDTAGRLTATEFSSYAYNAAGRITSLTQKLYKPADTNPVGSTIISANVTWVVGYDATGRVTGFNVNGAVPANTASFGYDASGNRSTSNRNINGQSNSRSYTLSGNRSIGFSQTSGTTTTAVAHNYNANGDLTSDGLRSYNYDAEGRLSATTTGATATSPSTRYAHNALGQRVFKTEPLYPPSQGDENSPGFLQSLINFFTQFWRPATAAAEQLGYAYIHDENGSLIGEYGMGGANSTGSTQYIYLPTGDGPIPVAVVVNGATFAVHADHLGTPRRLTNASGQAVWQWTYSAFGEEEPTTAAKRFTNEYTVSTSGTTTLPDVTFNLRYPGQYRDAESGLFYNYFRSYQPSQGRYTQSDPIGLDGGLNRYAYVDGDPLNFVDQDGLIKNRGGSNPRAAMPTPGNQSGGWSYGQFFPSIGPTYVSSPACL